MKSLIADRGTSRDLQNPLLMFSRFQELPCRITVGGCGLIRSKGTGENPSHPILTQLVVQ